MVTKMDDITSALLGEESVGEDIVGDRLRKEPVDDVENNGNGWLSKKKTLAFIIGSSVVTLIGGLMLGAVLFSGGDAEPQRFSVESVRDKLPVYEQLETMREDRISLLNKQLVDAFAVIEKNSPSQQRDGGLAMAGAINQANAQNEEISERVLSGLVALGKDCSEVAQVVKNGDAGAEDASTTNEISVVLRGLSGDLLLSEDKETIETVFVGGSPASDLNSPCHSVSSPLISYVAASYDDEGKTGDVLLAIDPVASDEGKLYSALYVLGVTNTGKIAYCAYAGVIGGETSLEYMKDVETAANKLLAGEVADDAKQQ